MNFTIGTLRSLCNRAAMHALLIAAPGALLAALSAHGELIDTVVATVDDEVILFSEVAETASILLDGAAMSGLTEAERREEIAAAHRQVLEQAIDNKILYREALLAGLPEKIPQLDERVEEQLDRIREQYESTEAFMAMVQSAGETLSDFRARLKKNLLAQAMANALLNQFQQEVTVDETEVAEYYEAHKSEFSHPAQSKVRRIYIDAGSDADSRARAKARIESLRQDLALGADFAELARAHSDAPDAELGGLRGWVSLDPEDGTFEPAVDAVVSRLEPGEVSEVVETQYGFLLLKVEEKRSAGMESLESVRTEIEPILRGRHAQAKYAKRVSELRKLSRIETFQF